MSNSNTPQLTMPDAYAPAKIATLVEQMGVNKASLSPVKVFILGVLAGVFIAFGAMLYTLVVTDPQLGWGLSRLVGGIAFSLGLVLVIVAGAELFTGNNLIVMAWANRDISTMRLLQNWTLVYIANFVGALAAAAVMVGTGLLDQSAGMMGESAIRIAQAKVTPTWSELFLRGVLCNTLVCLAVWLCLAAHDVASKIVAIVFPISAFVALGFEHSIANMYLIPVAMMHEAGSVSLQQFGYNLLPVTLGNIIGGSVLVALVYWLVYLRK